MTNPTVGVALLSMGNRPTELAAALESLGRQEGVDMNVTLVGNGWDPVDVPDWVNTHHSPENLGVTAGRNLAASMTTGEFIFFYDDDAYLPTPDIIRRMVDEMEPGVAVVQGRGVDPVTGNSPRRWVPRLRKSAELQCGDVAVFWEAMALIRREAFDEIGGWCPEFFFGHEGTDLAMRLIDAGWRIKYVPEIVVNHPATPASRHSHHFHTTMRNRVWVAKRNIPALLFPIYMGLWAGATLIRIRSLDGLRNFWRGIKEGFTTKTPGRRKPLKWSTVMKMAKLGRPPLW